MTVQHPARGAPAVRVSVVIPTLNEERNIETCLDALEAFDQVVVLDSGSSDRTVELAVGRGAQVVDFRWDGQYPKKKQWALDHLDLRHDWVLFVDGDERPSPELVQEIARTVCRPDLERFGAFDVRLDYYWGGRRLDYGHRVVKRALLHRGRTSFPVVDDLGAPGMGEQEGHYQPVTEHTVGSLTNRLRHEDLDPLSSWFARHNRYSDWEAYLRASQDVRSSVAGLRSRQGRLFERLPFKPLAFFMYSYVVRGGFRDGRAGFDYATALAFYYWQIALKTRERESLQQ